MGQSHSQYYRPSHIGSAISPQTLQTNWSDRPCLPTASAAASSELNPPHDEPLDPPAAHQEVTRKVRDSSISAPTSVKFLRSRITDGEASRNLGTYTDRETLSAGLLTWEPPVSYMNQTPCTGRIQVDVWISDCRSINE